MRYKHTQLILLILLLCIPSLGHAELWSGIVAPSRATDWTKAGVEGGIPSATWANCNNAACNALAPGGTGAVTADAIMSAISGAQVGGVACSASLPCVVRIRAGSFSLAGFQIRRSNIVVRGAGADKTLLTMTSDSPSSCHTNFGNAIAMCTDNNTQYVQNWTAGFAQGSQQITVASTSGLTAGQPIFLTQDDDTTDWPGPGDVNVCAAKSTTCSADGSGSSNFQPLGTAINSSYSAYKATPINSTTISLSPGIILPNYRAGRNGKALWFPSGTFLQNAGVEDLSFDFRSLTDSNGVLCVLCYNTWVKGVRSIAPLAQTPHHVNYVYSYRNTAQSNYWFGPEGLAGAINQYSLSQYFGFANLWENNILQQRQSALVTAAPMTGSVFAHNFFAGRPFPGVVLHGAGESMNLYEGNVMHGFYGDIDHGSHVFETVFRNALIGHRYGAAPFGSVQDAIHLQTKNRFFNVIGNVMGDNTYVSTYETTLIESGVSIYSLGWRGSASGVDPGTDTNVKRTLFRWGNWDAVTSSADTTNGDQTGTRWCGNSTNTGWATRCGSISEVPSTIPNFANPVPSTETLPASFYLAAKPSWWPDVRVKPWPAIGPNVTGGNITNLGGHAYTNPAADCYLNVMHGPVDGSGTPLTFNAAACYPSSNNTTPAPPPPTNFRVMPS